MNIKKFYLYGMFHSFMPIYAVSALLFKSNGISLFQISMLLAINAIPCFVLELPSGVIADRWSRKNLLIIADFLTIIGLLCWLFSTKFIMYAIGYICWGISSAFCSGSKEALLYDSLKCENNEDKFDLIYSRSNFIAKLSQVIACGMGGFLSSKFGMSCPLIISIIFSSLSAIFAISLKEVNLYRLQRSKQEKPHFFCIDELLFFKKKRYTAIVMVLSVFVLCSAGILEEYDQLILTDFGVSLSYIGLWAAFCGLFEGFGNLIAPRIKNIFQNRCHITKTSEWITILSITSAICLGITALIGQLWGLIFYAFYYFFLAVCGIYAEDYIQHKIEEEGRSTIHSIVSLLENLLGTFGFMILGVVFEWSNLLTGLLITAIFMIILILCFCYILAYLHRRNFE